MISIQKDVLLFFKTDAASSHMYKALVAQGYDKDELKAMFLALRTMGFLARTNTRGPMAASFCISRAGRRFLLAEWGIHLDEKEFA